MGSSGTWVIAVFALALIAAALVSAAFYVSLSKASTLGEFEEELAARRPELRPALEAGNRKLRQLKFLVVAVCSVPVAAGLARGGGLISTTTLLLIWGFVVASVGAAVIWLRRSRKLTFYSARANSARANKE